jgi:hypothetical protein
MTREQIEIWEEIQISDSKIDKDQEYIDKLRLAAVLHGVEHLGYCDHVDENGNSLCLGVDAKGTLGDPNDIYVCAVCSLCGVVLGITFLKSGATY